MGPGETNRAQMTPAAIPQSDGTIIYPRASG